MVKPSKTSSKCKTFHREITTSKLPTSIKSTSIPPSGSFRTSKWPVVPMASQGAARSSTITRCNHSANRMLTSMEMRSQATSTITRWWLLKSCRLTSPSNQCQPIILTVRIKELFYLRTTLYQNRSTTTLAPQWQPRDVAIPKINRKRTMKMISLMISSMARGAREKLRRIKKLFRMAMISASSSVPFSQEIAKLRTHHPGGKRQQVLESKAILSLKSSYQKAS